MKELIEFGRITGAHGLRGAVSLECFFENYEPLLGELTLNGGKCNFAVEGVKRGELIVKIEGVEHVDEARKLLKSVIYVRRSALEALPNAGAEGHFVADLLGLQVFVEGMEEPYGTLCDVVDFGGGALLEVRLAMEHPLNKGRKEDTEYLKKDEKTVKEVDLEKGRLIIYKPLAIEEVL